MAAVVQKNYTIADNSYPIYICVDHAGQFWFKAKDVARMLGCKDTDQLIRRHVAKEDKLPWSLLRSQNPTLKAPLNWQPATIMINELGLYDLCLDRAGKQFRRWMIHVALPSIREKRSHVMQKQLAIMGREVKHKDQQLVTMREKVKCKDQQLATMSEEKKHIQEKLLYNERKIKEQSPKLTTMNVPAHKLHVFGIFKKDNMYKGIRTQKRSFQKALKQVEHFQLVMFCKSVTNPINFFNDLKQKLKRDKIDFESFSNYIIFKNHVDIVPWIKETFKDYVGLHPHYFKNGEPCKEYRKMKRRVSCSTNCSSDEEKIRSGNEECNEINSDEEKKSIGK